MNSEILQNIRHRDETLNRFRKTKDLDLYKLYCKLRNKVHRETRNSKRDYLANTIEKKRIILKTLESIEKKNLAIIRKGTLAVMSYWKVKMKLDLYN